ncbi:MAG: nucleotidyltransferase domain-containing protein [Lachnospiraceae bacterium]|jgi:predicted nucleotidyltransferase|nr:nucleotidyltransferase domain-containing protein [Lachnospiraceae bacterium]
MNKFGISDNAFTQIIDTMNSFDFISKAVIFGSRAKGTHKKYSDVDICVFGKMDVFDAEKIKSALDELNVIYEFDVVNYESITTVAFREHIDRVGVIFIGDKDDDEGLSTTRSVTEL